MKPQRQRRSKAALTAGLSVLAFAIPVALVSRPVPHLPPAASHRDEADLPRELADLVFGVSALRHEEQLLAAPVFRASTPERPPGTPGSGKLQLQLREKGRAPVPEPTTALLLLGGLVGLGSLRRWLRGKQTRRGQLRS